MMSLIKVSSNILCIFYPKGNLTYMHSTINHSIILYLLSNKLKIVSTYFTKHLVILMCSKKGNLS